jgi:hypothetical protein
MLGLNVNNMLDHAAIVSLQQEYDLQGKGQSHKYTPPGLLDFLSNLWETYFYKMTQIYI